MKIIYKIFSTTIFTLILTSCVFSQVDTLNINGITIEAERLNLFKGDKNKILQLIKKDDIQKLAATHLNDLLKYVLNVDVRKRGSDEIQSDISIRGGSFEQLLILFNGMRINDPQTGHHNLNIPIDLDQIQRIEVMAGSGSRFYGANAFSGIINIVSPVPDKNYIRGGFLAGTNNLYEGHLSAGYAGKKTSQYFAVSAKSCQGYTNNTDYQIWKVFYSGNSRSKSGTMSWQAGYIDKAFGANSFYSVKYPNQFEQTKSFLGNIQYSTSGKVNFTPQIYWRRHHDRFELFRNNPAAWYKNHNYHLTNVIGAVANLRTISEMGSTSVRIELYNENIKSNVLGVLINDTIEDSMDESGFFTRKASRTNFSMAVEHSFTYSIFQINAGFLGNFNAKYGNDIVPGIDVSVKITPALKWYMSFNKSFRMPTFTDLYYTGPTNQGNSKLMPEKAYTTEGGLKYETSYINSRLIAYYRYGKNCIDWVKLPSEEKWRTANYTEMHTWGIEFATSLFLEKRLNKPFFITLISTSYAYNNIEKQEDAYLSFYVLDYMKHKLQLGVQFRIYKKLGLHFETYYGDRNGSFTDYSTGKEIAYKPFVTADARLFWNPKHFEIFLICQNVFNAKYYDFGNIIMPGIWMKAGVSYTLELSKKK